MREEFEDKHGIILFTSDSLSMAEKHIETIARAG